MILLLVLLPIITYAQDDLLTFGLQLPKYNDYPEPNLEDAFIFDRYSHIPGVIKIKYVGLHGLLFSQISRRVKGQAQENLRQEFHLNNMRVDELNRRMDALEIERNSTGEWYERPWFYSLPPEKGGAPRAQVTHEIGWDLKIPRNFPVLWWVKTQFESIGDIWIDSDREFNDVENTNRITNSGARHAPKDDNKNHYRLERLPNPDIGIASKDFRWYEGNSYHLRFKPTIRFSPTKGESKIINEVAMYVMVELFSNIKNHFADLVFFVRHDILKDETFFSAQLAFLSW